MMHQSDTMSEKCGNLRTSTPAYPFVLYEQHPNTDRSRTWICRSDDHLIAVAFFPRRI